MGSEAQIRNLVGRSCILLDEERFAEWLALCDPAMRYAIQAYSPEIQRDMTWMDLDYAGLEALFKGLPAHERDPGLLSRHPSILEVDDAEDGEVRAEVAVAIHRTAPDGATALFASVRYSDRYVRNGGNLRLRERVARTFTRIFLSDSGGSHLPL